MKRTHLHYLELLAQNKKLLILSNSTCEDYKKLLVHFESVSLIKIDQDTLDDLSTLLIEFSPNLVIFIPDTLLDFDNTIKLLDNCDNYIHSILMVPEKIIDPYKGYMNSFEAIILGSPSNDLLALKIFMVLGLDYAIEAAKSNNITDENSIEDHLKSLDQYLDMYEGNTLYIAEDIKKLSEKLDAGELNRKLLDDIVKAISSLAALFKKHKYTMSIAPIFDNFASFLNGFDYTNVDFSNFEGFDYLALILKDISFYLNEYFVERIVNDVNVFEHSLANSIDFMKNRLNNKEPIDDGSDLEFFN